MRDSEPGGHAGIRPRMVALRGVVAVLAVLAWQPVVSAATVINSPGPLSSISIGEGLGCQVQASGDTGGSFFPSSEPGACGTFLALTEGEDVTEGGFHLFGPNPPAGVTPDAPFKQVAEQTVNGTVVTTHVGAYEPDDGTPFELADLVETDSYVTGQDFYTTTITVRNLGNQRLQGTLYHAGDCLLANEDTGYGAENVPAAGSVACTLTPNDSPPGRYMAFTPTSTSGLPEIGGPQHLESFFGTVWSTVGELKPFPDEVEGTTNQDNGMGLSWPINLGISDGPENTATLKLTTTVSPSTESPTPVTPPPPPPSPGPPTFPTTSPPIVQTTTSAVFTATVNPGGLATSAHFEYGPVLGGGTGPITYTSATPSQSVGSDFANHTVTATVTGLLPNVTYHVRVVATNSAGSAQGVDQAFKTSADPPPPRPVLGKSVNVSVVSGIVLIELPPGTKLPLYSLLAPLPPAPTARAFAALTKGQGFVPLTEARQIPVGSILDTSAGVARITTATSTSAKGKLQLGDFGAGIFKLLQNRRQRGLTQLNIVDNHSARQVCVTRGKARIAAKHLSSSVLGRLNANSHGHFTARGQYSAATVRGTIWSVANQCDGTLTRVTRGVVQVRDFRLRKTITLFTGQSYLAKAP